jgi:hypothetical protein
MGTKAKWLKGKLTFYNNAVVEENVQTAGTTVGMSIRNYGMVVLNPAAAAKYTISGGPAIGQKLDIVCKSSLVASVYCSAVKNQVTIMCPNTKVNGFVMIPGSTHGCAVTLRGVTTKAWAITSFSTAVGGMALTTAHA